MGSIGTRQVEPGVSHSTRRQAALPPSHAIWALVRHVHQEFIAEARRSSQPSDWQALGDEVIGLHGRTWREIAPDYHDLGATVTISQLAAAELDGFADVIGSGPAASTAEPDWRAALADFRKHSAHWAARSGAAFAAYATYASIDWIGLRMTVRAGASPAAARMIVLGSFYGIFQPRSGSFEEALHRALFKAPPGGDRPATPSASAVMREAEAGAAPLNAVLAERVLAGRQKIMRIAERWLR